MAQQRHYSPRIDRFLVSCLYHEARRRRMPMTKLVDTLLGESLAGSHGRKRALEDRGIAEIEPKDRLAG